MMKTCFVCSLRYGTTPYDVNDLLFTSMEEEDTSDHLSLLVTTSTSKSKPAPAPRPGQESASTKSGETSGANEEKSAAEETAPVDVQPFQHLCDICLGLLKPRLREKIGQAVLARLREEKYDCEDFNLWVRYPGSCRVREIYYTHIQYSILQKKLREMHPNHSGGVSVHLPQISFTDTIKICVAKEVERLSNLKYNRHSELNITVVLQNETSDRVTQNFLHAHYPGICHVGRKRRRNDNEEWMGRFPIGPAILHEFEQGIIHKLP